MSRSDDTTPKNPPARVIAFDKIRAVKSTTEIRAEEESDRLMNNANAIGPTDHPETGIPDEPESAQLPDISNYMEGRLDLNRDIIKRPHATFYIKVSGKKRHSMHPGDILIVERGHVPDIGNLIVAVLHEPGELVVGKVTSVEDITPEGSMLGRLYIKFKVGRRNLRITENELWGCVIWILHNATGDMK